MRRALLPLLLLSWLAPWPVMAKNEDIKLDLEPTTAALFDYYFFNLNVGDEPPHYQIVIVTWHKVDLKDAKVLDETGAPMKVVEAVNFTKNMAKYERLVVELTREQMVTAKEKGWQFNLTSARGGTKFKVAAREFAKALKTADEKDVYRRSELARAPSENPDPEARLNETVRLLAETFNFEAVKHYLGQGPGRVYGQAFSKTRSGEVRLAAGGSILLIPDDPWTRSAFRVMKTPKFDSLPSDARTYMVNAIRLAQADAGGNFEFENVPPGEYRVDTLLTWQGPRGLEGGILTKNVTVGFKPVKVLLTDVP